MQAELDKYIRKLESSKLHPIIFISGFRGSGKTTLAKKLVATYLNAIHFDSDWYQKYSTKERVSRVKRALDSGDNDLIDQEENPSNNYNWDLFEKDLKELQARGRLIIENARDQKTGEKNLKRVLDFEGMGGVIICDGHRIIHPEVIGLSDFSILLDVDKDKAGERANKRDEHRSSPEHLTSKKILLEKYDVHYFNLNRKNVNLILHD